MRDCPPGYFCEAGTENYLDSPCVKGTYRAEPRGTAQSDCSICPKGFFCIEDEAAPIACPRGTYCDYSADGSGIGCDSVIATSDSTSTYADHGGAKPCVPCDEGYQCPYVGMEAALECGEGFYSQAGAYSCTLCQQGYQCTGTTMTATAYEDDSNKCTGYNCEIFADEIYEKSDCAEGYYCPADSLFAVPCPRGTYRDDTGSTPNDVSACLDVPAG